MLSKRSRMLIKNKNFEKRIKDLKDKLKNKKVLIYGAGMLFEAAYKKYDFTGLNIIGISDLKFEKDNIANWHNLKTFKPSEIKDLNPDVILITLEKSLLVSKDFILKYKNSTIICLFLQKDTPMFENRNINHNIWIETYGLHGKKPRTLSSFELFCLKFKTKFNKFLNKLDIPQIEFNITTKCTLKCKHCTNYIPYIENNEHLIISIDDFKKQLNNLLRAVNEIKNLLILGGEPLLVKNLHEYLEYASSKKKIKKVWIVTNGTIPFNQDLITAINKYKNKVVVWISNYSKNEELKNKLHHSEIIEQLNSINTDIDYVQDLNWNYTSPLNKNKLRLDTKDYFRLCLHKCTAVFGGKIYVCPRAGVFDMKKIYKPENNEVIDLNYEDNPAKLKKKLIQFYSRDSFSACYYCTILEDKAHSKIKPAIQAD